MQQGCMSEIIQFDEYLFRIINQLGQNDFFDFILPFWRNKINWIPLYLVLISILIYKLKTQSLYLLLAIGVTIGISDTLSSKIIKKTVKRERPCRADGVQETARVLVHCGGGYSFTSSHATNHFALAIFLILSTSGIFYKWRWLLLPWAFFVAYAQVYVGVHFPLDVFFGAMLGSVVAYLVYKIYSYILISFNHKKVV